MEGTFNRMTCIIVTIANYVMMTSTCSTVIRHLCDTSSDLTTAWLAQLVERQSVVRKVEGSSSRPDQHSGS